MKIDIKHIFDGTWALLRGWRALVFVFPCCVSTAYADNGYRFIEMSHVPANFIVTGINDNGQVVGFGGKNNKKSYVYDIKTDTFSVLPRAEGGGSDFNARGIDNSEDVAFSVNYSVLSPPPPNAGYYNIDTQSYVSIPPPPAATCSFGFNGMNNVGNVVGELSNYTCDDFAFILDTNSGTYKILNQQNGSALQESTIFALNDAGVGLVQVMKDNNLSYALYDIYSERYTALGSKQVSYNGINNLGWLVGAGGGPGFILDPSTGHYTTLSHPRASHTVPLMINNEGVVAGYWEGNSGQHPFIAEPPALIDDNTKVQAFAVFDLLNQVSDTFGYAAIVTDPKHIVQNVAAESAIGVLAKAISGNDQVFKNNIELSAGEVEFFRDAAKRLPSNPISGMFTLLSLSFKGAASIAGAIFSDPPDFNYRHVERPHGLALPQSGNAVADKAIADYLNYASLLAAKLHAAERWEGATIDGDKKDIALQLNAYNAYSIQMKGLTAELNGDNKALAKVLPTETAESFPGGADAIAKAFHAQCGKGLPVSLNKKLLALGYSQKSIDHWVCVEAGSIKASQISTRFKKLLAEKLPRSPDPEDSFAAFH